MRDTCRQEQGKRCQRSCLIHAPKNSKKRCHAIESLWIQADQSGSRPKQCISAHASVKSLRMKMRYVGSRQQREVTQTPCAMVKGYATSCTCLEIYIHTIEKSTHIGLQQRGGQDVGPAAGQFAVEVPSRDAPLSRIARPAHNVCVPLRLLGYELRDVLGLRTPHSRASQMCSSAKLCML